MNRFSRTNSFATNKLSITIHSHIFKQKRIFILIKRNIITCFYLKIFKQAPDFYN